MENLLSFGIKEYIFLIVIVLIGVVEMLATSFRVVN